MSASPRPSDPLERLRPLLAELPGGGAWRSQREQLWNRLLAAGLPTTRDEPWKYANLRLLARRDLAPAAPRPITPEALAAAPDAAAGGATRLIFVDGRYQAGLAQRLAPPSSLQLSTFAAVVEAGEPDPGTPLAGDPDLVDERLRAWNGAFAVDGPVIRVPARATPPAVHVVHLATGGGAYPRTRIALEPGAQLELVETHLTLGAAEATVVAATEVEVGAGAELTHTVLQVLGERAVLLEDLAVEVGAGGHYRHRLAALGGQFARLDLRVRLAAAGAAVELAGLLFADGQREQHVRTLVTHAAPRTSSDQLYRGVGAGRGRGSYDGKVVVGVGAAGTESRQSSRHLLIGREAAFDSRPQLEINADDVKCSHGATTGTLDPQMLFYLLSRGIDAETARALLTYAFLGEVLRRFSVEPVRRAAEQRVLGRLPSAELLREFVA
ncbi:MAG: Fe-S cluster assembly protein SufD [Proteobacteria bacterium]|nr:Fe-S cluster assembly protein SufD [Pseudomonadota bacterium]